MFVDVDNRNGGEAIEGGQEVIKGEYIIAGPAVQTALDRAMRGYDSIMSQIKTDIVAEYGIQDILSKYPLKPIDYNKIDYAMLNTFLETVYLLDISTIDNDRAIILADTIANILDTEGSLGDDVMIDYQKLNNRYVEIKGCMYKSERIYH